MHTVVKSFLKDDVEIKGNKNIAEEFNSYFANIGAELAAKINDPNNNVDVLDYIVEDVAHSMFLSPATETEIVNIVHKFKNKMSGYDEINMFLVKNVIEYIAGPLTHICNLSFLTGVFPNRMKLAKVIPIFKAGNKNVFGNYRPISLLTQFSKILEKLFCERLVTFLHTNNTLSHGQYGFRRNLSTSYALIELNELITDSIDQGNYSIGLFVDLRKAFDTIDHNILTKKLLKYGIRGIVLDWVKDYLSNRKQFTCYSNSESSKLNISHGMPQ